MDRILDLVVSATREVKAIALLMVGAGRRGRGRGLIRAEPSATIAVEAPGIESPRLRLRLMASRLRDAVIATDRAGFVKLARVIADGAVEIEDMLEAASLPATMTVERAIARGERAVDVSRAVLRF